LATANKPKKRAGRPKKKIVEKEVKSTWYVPEGMGANSEAPKPKVNWIPATPAAFDGKNNDTESAQKEIEKHEKDLVYLRGLSSPTSLTKKSIAFAERKIAELQKQINPITN
jgi:hypothetical protein